MYVFAIQTTTTTTETAAATTTTYKSKNVCVLGQRELRERVNE